MHNPEFDGDYLEAANAEAAERDDFESPPQDITWDDIGFWRDVIVGGLIAAAIIWATAYGLFSL